MNGFMRQIFSFVCGQNVAHTWAPGGVLLPLCQRCTGFYVGAAISLILLLVFRPPLNGRYRWFHVALVLGMTPFGFHLVPHGAVLRTVSGQWFGFGVVGLLWLLPGLRSGDKQGRAASSRGLHLLLGLTSVILLPAFACWGGAFAAMFVPWIAFAGLTALAVLLLADISIFFSWIFAWLHAWNGRATP